MSSFWLFQESLAQTTYTFPVPNTPISAYGALPSSGADGISPFTFTATGTGNGSLSAFGGELIVASVSTSSSDYMMSVVRTDAADFDLESFTIENSFGYASATVNVTGRKDGADVSGATYSTSMPGNGSTKLVDLSSDDDFNDLDEFRITFSGTVGSSWGFHNITAGPASPLPISLADFQAHRLDENIQLNWSTFSEQNNLGFEIEQSIDGESFEQIGFVAGAGNSSVEQTYTFSLQHREAAYYRFKQIDLDGNFSFSPVRFISAWTPEQEPLLYPNPIVDRVSIGNVADDVRLGVKVIDLQGRQLMVLQGNKREVEQQLSQDFAQLAKGMYLIHLRTSKQSFKLKVIKE
ncbi:MAG: T9SS type A sorting domain-containing protein [Bacteroidota bacterium]